MTVAGKIEIPVRRTGLSVQEKSVIERNNITSQWRELRTNNNELLRRQILEGDFAALMTDVLGYNYDDFQATVYALQCRSKKNMILAPRGFGKSTLLTVGRIVHEVLKNPNIRILIGSKTDTQARSFLDEIKQNLLKERLVEIFGIQGGDRVTTWNEDAINVRGRTIAAKEKTVTALGAGGAVTSRHFDLIVVDDLVDNKNSRTALQRREIHKFFYQTLRPCLEPNGRIYVMGTRYHPSDLYDHLMKKDPEFKNTTYIVPALVNKKSQYPERFSAEELVSLRVSMGTVFFESQFQMNADAMRGEIFDYDHFQWIGQAPSNLKIYAAADLAIGRKTQNDFFAISVIGWNPEDKLFVLETYRGKISLAKQNEMIGHYHGKWDPIYFGIEANAYQAAKLQELKNNPETRTIRAVPIFTKDDKVTRFQKFAVYYERGDVYHLDGQLDHLEDEMCSFPRGEHDDIIDATEMAAMVRFRNRRKKRRKEPGVIG